VDPNAPDAQGRYPQFKDYKRQRDPKLEFKNKSIGYQSWKLATDRRNAMNQQQGQQGQQGQEQLNLDPEAMLEANIKRDLAEKYDVSDQVRQLAEMRSNRMQNEATTKKTIAETKALDLARQDRESLTPAQREVLQGDLPQHEKEFHIKRLGVGEKPLDPTSGPFAAWSRLTVLDPGFFRDNQQVPGGPDFNPEHLLTSARQYFGAKLDDPNSEESRAVRIILENRMTPDQRAAATAPGAGTRFLESIFGRDPATQQLGDFIGGKPAAPAQPAGQEPPGPIRRASPAQLQLLMEILGRH
jgi:hypothetical protein